MCDQIRSMGGEAEDNVRNTIIVAVIAGVIFIASIFSPPHLMDDVDAVQAQISRTMLESGDWVTPHLNGIAYLEKYPLGYWLSAISHGIIGVNDWAGSLHLVLSVVNLYVAN